jgi:hypothetical protein
MVTIIECMQFKKIGGHIVTDQTNELSMRKIAITAGISFLIMTIAAGFSYGYALGKLFVLKDAGATVSNIIASPILFRISILGFLIILICDVIVAWALYVFFKQVNKSLSLLTALFRLIYITFLGIAILNLVFILLLINDTFLSKSFEPNQLQLQVMLYINGFKSIWSIGLVIFGLHLLGLGYLVFKSSYIPKIIGFLIIISSLCYITTNLLNLLVPMYVNYKDIIETILSLPMAIGELLLAFWLFIKGGK